MIVEMLVVPNDLAGIGVEGERRAYREAHPADSWVDFSAGVRCILGFNAGTPMTPSAYNNNMQLFQTPGHVVIVTEMAHTARVVPLDGRPHLSSDIRSGQGIRGATGRARRWSSRRATSPRSGAGGARPRARTWVERLTRLDVDTLVYEFTVTDPRTWTRPWTASVTMALNPEPMYEYACHEGNYSMPLMLAGQRTEQKAAAEQP